MNFLLLLLVLLAERFSTIRHTIQQDGWWFDLLRRCERPQSPWATLVWTVLVPLLIVGLLLRQLDYLFGGLTFFLDLLIVFYSLGRGDPRAELGTFCEAWYRGDEEAASHIARRELGISANNSGELFEQVQMHLLWQGYQGFFAVIFWYALLGPLIALAYRLLDLVERHAETSVVRELAGQLRHALDWLPARVLAISFALVGNFAAFARAVLPNLLHWRVYAPFLLLQTGILSVEPLGSVRGEQGVARIDSLWSLLFRAGMLWYVALAIWTVVL
ncbi:regulatory signaling modulator protein AmpE [Azomonas macrocytogenes]|uniref:AmpE protein n=1 Tax=Azomonas macrocytogenes TaxID=69962 RepID=A0A839SZT1_AZOMA|nr:regulatory signaling modulator protein AmpE [Azomonas macrocytogenes]MBB3102398.1 AmpE protein [Azomonas macrocytogenes]